ncbi:MAG: ADP-ribosylglycohydrolase family protein [Bacteroidota bacterium]
MGNTSVQTMTTQERTKLAHQSLRGVAIGDAFGESFFGETDRILHLIQQRKMPDTSWEFTDDTVMAIAVYDQLKLNQTIHQDQLAQAFATNQEQDINRGYGATARRILREIGEGGDWKEIAQGVFEGMGSMGNGASMRVSPIGAFFYDDLDRVKALAIQSAEITHTHLEGITGAIAVAIGTAIATEMKAKNETMEPNEFIQRIVDTLPDSDTKSKIQKAMRVPYTYHIETVKSVLGNGSKITAQDTVPFAIWCAAHNLTNFEASLWKAVSILGDRDTICAIVGGITIMSTDEKHIPKAWTQSVEDVDTSVFMRNM